MANMINSMVAAQQERMISTHSDKCEYHECTVHCGFMLVSISNVMYHSVILGLLMERLSKSISAIVRTHSFVVLGN